MRYVEKDHNEGDWEYDEVIKEEYRNGLLHSDQQWRTSSCQKTRVQTEPSFPDPFPYLVKHSKPPSAPRAPGTSSASQLMKCMKKVQHEDLNVTEVINEFVKELNGNDMYNQQILSKDRV